MGTEEKTKYNRELGMCPALMIANGGLRASECIGDDCEWWVEDINYFDEKTTIDSGTCSIYTIAKSVEPKEGY